MRQFFFLFAIFFLTNQIAIAQGEPIVLNNPSFEGLPKHSQTPSGWYDCGFPNESEPDIQPNYLEDANDAFFAVTMAAQEGNTYLGMVVRDNDTYEMVGQRLPRPVEKGKCYEFSVSLARSSTYLSISRATGKTVNYTSPVKFRVWGGNGYCGRAELLAETSLVINESWKIYNMKFEPSGTYSYIMLEAYYRTPVLFPYNGNVLVDNASPIYPIPCDVEVPDIPEEVEEVVADQTAPVPPTPTTPNKKTAPENPTPLPDEVIAEASQPTQPKEKKLKGLDRSTLKEGQTIKIDKLYFPPDQTAPTENSFEVLDEVYDFLAENKNMVVEIGGHTNTIPEHEYCDKLSTARAKSVVDYLIKKGINQERLQYKGYGKREPLIFDKYSRANRKKNQRVEIKVLSFNQ